MPSLPLLLHRGAQRHLPTLTPSGMQGSPYQEDQKTRPRAGRARRRVPDTTLPEERDEGTGAARALTPRGGERPVRDRRPSGEKGLRARREGGAGQGGVAVVTYTGQQPRYG